MESSCESCLTTFPELEVIFSQLKCGICYEFMKTPMTTSCAHTYCSICIRTWITTRQMCPTCQVEVRDETLRNNLALENCLGPFINLQKKLHKLCNSEAIRNLKPLTKPTEQVQPKGPDSNPKLQGGNCQIKNKDFIEVKPSPKPPSTPEHKKTPARQENEPSYFISPAKIPGLFLQSPKSTKQQRPRSDIFTSPTSNSPSSSSVQNEGTSSSTQTDNAVKVMCPVCSVEIPERNINTHLDKCLTLPNNPPLTSPRTPEVQRREPLKKLVYHIMAEKELRKKLKDYLLSTKGDRSQLVNRLQRYVTLYNSECDSLNPRPLAEIRKQLEKEEEAMNKTASTSSKIFRVPRNADAAEIEEINKQYINENKSVFDDLIRQVRERDKKTGGKSSKDSVPPNRSSAATSGSGPKSEDEDTDADAAITWKRNRTTDEDESDEFSNSKPVLKTSKSRILEESEDDECFVPKRGAKWLKTPARTELANGVLSRILPKPRQVSESRDSSDDDIDKLDDIPSPSSPVLSLRSPDNVKGKKKRPHRTAQKREVKKKVGPPTHKQASPDDQPRAIGKLTRAKRMRVCVEKSTESRTPSPFKGFDRDGSETPELESNEKKIRRDDESDEESNCQDDNLSQLLNALSESGSQKSNPKTVTTRRSTRESKRSTRKIVDSLRLNSKEKDEAKLQRKWRV